MEKHRGSNKRYADWDWYDYRRPEYIGSEHRDRVVRGAIFFEVQTEKATSVERNKKVEKRTIKNGTQEKRISVHKQLARYIIYSNSREHHEQVRVV